MDKTDTQDATHKISLIIKSEKKLEKLINDLIALEVARHDISVQGSSEELSEKYGTPYVAPEVLEKKHNPPKSEAFLEDDFNWIVGLSIGVPVFICVVLGIFVIGDVLSLFDNIVYGILGALVGGVIGTYIAFLIVNRHKQKIKKQEDKGGYVLWITVYSKKQLDEVLRILKRHKAENIKVDL